MLSAIGPAAELRRFGIPLIKDLSVGKNLMDHPAVSIFFRFPPRSPKNATLQMYLDTAQFALCNEGPYTGVGLLSVNAFLNSINGSTATYPDYQLVIIHLRQGTGDMESFTAGFRDGPTKEALIEELKTYVIALFYVTLLDPESRGKVTLNSGSYDDKPNINTNFLHKEYDIRTLVRAIEQQIKIEKTKAFRAYGGEFIQLPLPECDCDHKFPSTSYLRY